VKLRTRAAAIARRSDRLEPFVRAAREAREPYWRRINDRDDRHLRIVLMAALKPTSNVVDVGAAGGWFLDEILPLAGEGTHAAVEARPDAVADLKRRYPDVVVHGVAVAAEAGERQFTMVHNQPYLSGFAPRDWPHDILETEVVTVTAAPLDDLVPHRVDVLKIDVEGAEEEALRGARRLLGEHHPLIIFEHGATVPTDANDPSHSQIWHLLDELGYRVYSAAGDGPLSAADFAAASSSGRCWNFFAR
jgi:FkbM family methyltransferase